MLTANTTKYAMIAEEGKSSLFVLGAKGSMGMYNVPYLRGR